MIKSIIILGDSTSMTIGADRVMYPFKLAEKKAWAEGTKLFNCSLPGFTSMDACRYFFEHKKEFGDIGAVIIYLGNCDTMATEIPKNKYSYFRSLKFAWKGRLGKELTKSRIKNKLLYFQWNKEFDLDAEEAVSAALYEENIRLVLSYCKRQKINVVLVRPEAHVMFPSGSGKGNYVFYHYLGLNPVLSDRLIHHDDRLIAAAKCYEGKKFQIAADIYMDMLLNPDDEMRSLEYQTLLVNNYATSKAELGALDEADYLLTLLLKERGGRKEIILYNLSMIAKLRGDVKKSSEYLRQSYETDASMYRVREPYKKAVDRLAAQYEFAKLVDMQDVVNDNDYVDHCHPLPEAQERLAAKIFNELNIPSLQGRCSLKIVNQLYNPEYSIGNNTEFYSYFNAYAKITQGEIEKKIEELRTSCLVYNKSEPWPDNSQYQPGVDLSGAAEYWQRHPALPSLYDVIKARPCLPIDVGRFPEFFLVRLMVPLLEYFESRPDLKKILTPRTGVLRSAEELQLILPTGIPCHDGSWLLGADRQYLNDLRQRIVTAAKSMLNTHLGKKNQIEDRLKTTIFWYFREVLRFGPQSRVSMRYERVQLEFIAEALASCVVIGHLLGDNMHENAEEVRLFKFLEDVVETHEKYCQAYKPDHLNDELFSRYDKDLLKLRNIIKG